MEAQVQQQQAIQQRNRLLIGALVVIAVVAAVAAILLSSNPVSTASSADYDNLTKSRTEDGGFVIGSADAPVTVVEFADFTCPHCQDYHETTERFIKDFVATGQAKFEYRMMPVTGSPYMEHAAQLAECADTLKPGSFWAARDLLFKLASARRYDNMAQEVANKIGVGYADLLQCTRTATQYVTDGRVGQQAGVQGTPAVMVRYGNGDLQWISLGGQTMNRGPVTYDVLAQVVRQSQ